MGAEGTAGASDLPHTCGCSTQTVGQLRTDTGGPACSSQHAACKGVHLPGGGEDDFPDLLLPIEPTPVFEAASPSPAAFPPSSHMPLFPPHPMRVSDECECAGEDLSESVVSGRDAPDSGELAEFKVQMA